MINTELIQTLVYMFRDYFIYFMPVFGVFAGMNLIVKWMYSFMFKPFNKLSD